MSDVLGEEIIWYCGKMLLVRDEKIIATGKTEQELQDNLIAYEWIQDLKKRGEWLLG